jgi:hypothetical protein
VASSFAGVPQGRLCRGAALAAEQCLEGIARGGPIAFARVGHDSRQRVKGIVGQPGGRVQPLDLLSRLLDQLDTLRSHRRPQRVGRGQAFPISGQLRRSATAADQRQQQQGRHAGQANSTPRQPTTGSRSQQHWL